jgi:iron(III) transport system substrate-binding protein
MLKKLAIAIACLATTSVFALAGTAEARTQLLVYTAVEADELSGFKEAFESDHPDIEINWVRDSTGVVTSKLLAEKNNPQADIVWGLAATSLMLLDKEGYFQPYKPQGLDKLDARYVDSNEPPTWVGQRAWIAAICFNTVEAERHGIPQPTSWQDLTDPVYKGHIVMPNPNSSGTGFLDVSSWIQMWSEDEAWAYMDALHENIMQYTHSGSAPCRQAAAGEAVVGISFAYRGARLKEEGAPIAVIAPEEGSGWDLEAFAIVDGTDKLEAAQALADWSVSRRANEIYAENYAVVAMPGVGERPAHFPAGIEERMIDNDFLWAAENRMRILDEWRNRYDAKTEKEKDT